MGNGQCVIVEFSYLCPEKKKTPAMFAAVPSVFYRVINSPVTLGLCMYRVCMGLYLFPLACSCITVCIVKLRWYGFENEKCLPKGIPVCVCV